MSLMHHPLLRIASAGVLGALMAGCVGVPGDPYYDGGYSGGGYYRDRHRSRCTNNPA